jgi:hypothetical protein
MPTHSIWGQFLAGEILVNSAVCNIAFSFLLWSIWFEYRPRGIPACSFKRMGRQVPHYKLIVWFCFLPQRGTPICYVSDMSRLQRCLPHTAAECRPSSEPQGLFQCVICILLRNPVARFAGKIAWTRDRLKINSLFGAEDGMDLPYCLLSVLQTTQTHNSHKSKLTRR